MRWFLIQNTERWAIRETGAIEPYVSHGGVPVVFMEGHVPTGLGEPFEIPEGLAQMLIRARSPEDAIHQAAMYLRDTVFAAVRERREREASNAEESWGSLEESTEEDRQIMRELSGLRADANRLGGI